MIINVISQAEVGEQLSIDNVVGAKWIENGRLDTAPGPLELTAIPFSTQPAVLR
jgi:hypothetical protein